MNEKKKIEMKVPESRQELNDLVRGDLGSLMQWARREMAEGETVQSAIRLVGTGSVQAALVALELGDAVATYEENGVDEETLVTSVRKLFADNKARRAARDAENKQRTAALESLFGRNCVTPEQSHVTPTPDASPEAAS